MRARWDDYDRALLHNTHQILTLRIFFCTSKLNGSHSLLLIHQMHAEITKELGGNYPLLIFGCGAFRQFIIKYKLFSKSSIKQVRSPRWHWLSGLDMLSSSLARWIRGCLYFTRRVCWFFFSPLSTAQSCFLLSLWCQFSLCIHRIISSPYQYTSIIFTVYQRWRMGRKKSTFPLKRPFSSFRPWCVSPALTSELKEDSKISTQYIQKKEIRLLCKQWLMFSLCKCA